jgi:hypothetical protein
VAEIAAAHHCRLPEASPPTLADCRDLVIRPFNQPRRLRSPQTIIMGGLTYGYYGATSALVVIGLCTLAPSD